MGQLASKGQLRMSFMRWALVTVPAIMLAGLLSGRLSGSGSGNAWFEALAKPGWMPPGWVFGTVWPLLYIMLGIALAMILNARSARGRGAAIGLFLAQLTLNFAWSPLFFAAHRVTLSFWTILAILVLAGAAAFLFARIRAMAAWLMLPYLLWLALAGALTWEIGRLNPEAEQLVPREAAARIML